MKGKTFLITESLIGTRVGLQKEAHSKSWVRNVCATDGHILCKENNRVFLCKK